SCTVGPESCSVRRRLERERIDGDANQIGCGAGAPPGDRADRAARGGWDRLLLEAGRHGRAGAALVALGGSGASLLCDCGAAHLACPTTEPSGAARGDPRRRGRDRDFVRHLGWSAGRRRWCHGVGRGLTCRLPLAAPPSPYTPP